MKVYDDLDNLIKESSQEYQLINKKERYATRKLLTRITNGEYSEFFREVSPYLLPCYKTS